MKKILLLLTVAICTCTFGFTQNASIKGITTDTINKQNLTSTVVSLLRAKDSILVKFARANAKGEFEMKNLKAGNYILFVTYPEYADYAENITLTDTSNINTGPLKLILKANLLQEVIVKQQIGSIRLKGDTTEFIADSFKVQPNATVEDLKQMPGIQIDKNGKITAQGQSVQKVLVDGEEFFGDDPTLVTQNLRADMVGSVQVYDKKSDQATFTGIDDGSREKTINLKLKDGKKNGYFGRVSLSGGTDGYHDNQVMANVFKNKLKMAGYGIVSNTGKTGLNWQDVSNYGDQNNNGMMTSDDGGMMIMFGGGGDDFEGWSGQYNGQGNPLVQTGGLHFNNKFNDDKVSLNGNYKIMNLMVNSTSVTNSENVLQNNILTTDDYQKMKNSILRNRGNGTYEQQFDSTTSIKVNIDGGSDHKITATSDSSDIFTNGDIINKTKRLSSSIGDNSTLNSNILLKKRFKKPGRTLSFNLRENYTHNNASGSLYAVIDSFYNNEPSGISIIDQHKTYNSTNLLIDTKLTYTEPLSKTSSIILNYGIVVNNNNSERNSYNKSPDGKYTSLDTVYSNHYQFNVFTNRAGIAYNYAKKKVRFNLGNNFGITNFTQTNLRKDSVAKRDFVDFYPTANFSYAFTQQRRISINYTGGTRQPSIQQIQPVATNDDPLNVTIGNANLKPEYGSSINLNFNDFKILSQRGIYMGVYYHFTENAISNNTLTDLSTGKRTTTYVNLNGNNSLSSYFGYSLKLKKLDAFMGLNGNIGQNHNVYMIDNALNTTNSGNYTARLYFGKEKEKKFSLNFSVYSTYTTSTSTVQSAGSTNYWTFGAEPDIDVFLPWKLQIHTDGSYTYRQKTATFSSYSAFILNAWFGRKFFKNDALVIKVQGNDILNQNIGFDRQVTSNYTYQKTYNTIQRYFFLSAVWNFNKAGVKAPTGMF